MKTSLVTLVAIFGLVGFGIVTGFVGIHYPRVIENQPLRNPIAVAKVEGSRITLFDGRILELEDAAPTGSWEEFFSTGSKIEIEENGPDEVTIWGNKPGWICGTPWARPLRIPLIEDRVYRNRREILCFASYKKSTTKAEPQR